MNEPTRGQRLFFGALSVACGVAPILAAFDVGPLDRGDINGPPWLGVVAGGLFVVAGLTLWAGRMSPIASGVLALVLLAGFAALGNWIAFGFGERHCAGGLSLPFFSGDGELSGLACRIPFGVGALVVDGMLIVAATRLLQQLAGGPPRLARLVRFGDGCLLLSLAPILVPVFLVLILGSAASALWTRLRTGAWPRNEAFIARMRQRGRRGEAPNDRREAPAPTTSKHDDGAGGE